MTHCRRCGARIPRAALRAARENRGEVREDTAEALRVTPLTVGRWERGETEVSLAYRGAIATHFGITFDELRDWLHPACAACRPSRSVVHPPATREVSEQESRQRRELLHTVLARRGLGLATLVLTAASRLPGTLADGDADDLEAAVDRYGYAYPKEPPSVLLPGLVADFADTTRARAARDTSQLASASARLAGLVAGSLNNLGCWDEARPWLAVAARDAEVAQDVHTSAWLRTRPISRPLWHGQPGYALEQIQAVPEPPPSSGAGILALQEAHAHASLGNPREALAAVRRAERGVGHGSGVSVFTLTEPQFCWWAADVYARLGALAEAEWAQRVAYKAHGVRDRATIDMGRAKCLAHAGEPEAAVEQVYAVLDELPAGQRISYILARAADLASDLSGCDSPKVRDYVDTFART